MPPTKPRPSPAQVALLSAALRHAPLDEVGAIIAGGDARAARQLAGRGWLEAAGPRGEERWQITDAGRRALAGELARRRK